MLILRQMTSLRTIGSASIKIIAVLGLAGTLAGCEPPGAGTGSSARTVPPVSLPPNRIAYDTLSARDQVRHAIAVQTVLENPTPGVPTAWTGRDGTQGEVVVVSSHKMASGRLCRVVLDTISVEGGTQGINDVACWSGWNWHWLRQQNSPAVLAPLATHEVKRGRSFRNLARRLKVKRQQLKLLNPALADRVEPGTVVYLPRAG